jgi:predicted MFS family arabinose efflux permease
MTAQSEFRGRLPLIAAAAIGLSAGMTATMFYSLGAFMPSLEAEFGWSRGDISLGVTVMTVAIFLGGAITGRLCDRFGAAAVGAASLLTYAIGVVAMVATMSRIWEFWGCYFIIALMGVGSTPIVLVRPIIAAFHERRGLALGIALTGAGIAGFWVPRLVAGVSEVAGWRSAYLAIAAIAALAAPIVWFGFRSIPQGYAQTLGGEATEVPGMEVAQALRTRTFWLLIAMGFAMASGIAGVVVHLVPLFRDLGSDPITAAARASIVGLASVGGRIVVGALLDRFAATRVSLAILVATTIGILLLWASGLNYAPLAAALLGLAAGAEIDLLAYLTAQYFGQRRYGAIYGWQYSVFALGYGLSPFAVGLMRDRAGSYDPPLLASAAFVTLSALLTLALPRRTSPFLVNRSSVETTA